MTAEPYLGFLVLFLTAVCGWFAPALFGIDATRLALPIRVLFRLSFWYLSLSILIAAAGWLELATGQASARPSLFVVGAVLIIVCGLATLRYRKPAQTRPVREQSGTPISVPARLVLVAVATQVVVTFALDPLQYPRGFEGNAYHLPIAVHTVQTGSLLPWDHSYPHTFPALASALYAFYLWMLPESFIVATNAALVVLLILALYGTAINIGANRSAAVISSAGVASVPLVAFSALQTQADVAGLAFMAAALFFATSAQLHRITGVLAAGALCGLAIASKPLFIPASVALLAVLLFAVQRQDSAEGSMPIAARTRKVLDETAWFCVAAAAFGGFWFVRNWMLFGNPLHPVSFGFLEQWLGWRPAMDVNYSDRSFTQFGWVRAPAEWWVYPWVEWDELGQNFKGQSGLGAIVAAVLLPAYVFAGAKLASAPKEAPAALAFWAAAAFVVVTWWLLGDRQPRYILPAFAFALPLTAWSISQAEGWPARGVEWLAVVAIGLMALVISSKELVGFADRVLLSGMKQRHLFYEYPRAIDELPRGSRILNLAGRTWHYPLFGSGLRNEVISTPAARRALVLEPSLGAITEAKLDAAIIRRIGATHVFETGSVISMDGCVRLTEIARWDRNPVNGVPTPSPRILWRVNLCAAG